MNSKNTTVDWQRQHKAIGDLITYLNEILPTITLESTTSSVKYGKYGEIWVRLTSNLKRNSPQSSTSSGWLTSHPYASVGVCQPRRFRGLWFSSSWIARNSLSERSAMSVPLGKYARSWRLRFSLPPRWQLA